MVKLQNKLTQVPTKHNYII